VIERGTLGRVGAPATGETFREVARLHDVVIEEIVSSAHPDPIEFRQSHDEWVVVFAGDATLDVDGTELSLGPDEWVWIPAGTPHRVRRTEAGTRWLAVHVPRSATDQAPSDRS
jgi:cupin 2 domain-containing protein